MFFNDTATTEIYTLTKGNLIPPYFLVWILLLLGAWAPLSEEVTSEPHSIVVKLRGFVGSLQLSCVESPNLVCKGPVAAFKGTNSGIMASRIM